MCTGGWRGVYPPEGKILDPSPSTTPPEQIFPNTPLTAPWKPKKWPPLSKINWTQPDNLPRAHVWWLPFQYFVIADLLHKKETLPKNAEERKNVIRERIEDAISIQKSIEKCQIEWKDNETRSQVTLEKIKGQLESEKKEINARIAIWEKKMNEAMRQMTVNQVKDLSFTTLTLIFLDL